MEDNKFKQAKDIVMKKSHEKLEHLVTPCEGYDFEGPFNFENYVEKLESTGFQSSKLGQAITIINHMIKTKLELKDNMKIFLAFTSGIGSSGIREAINYLCKHKMIDVIITTAGSLEEDIMKTMNPHFIKPTYVGNKKIKIEGNDAGQEKKSEIQIDDFENDEFLRDKGFNRIYNLIVPNKNYEDFENFMDPVIENMLEKQRKENFRWTPSKMVKFFGKVLSQRLKSLKSDDPNFQKLSNEINKSFIKQCYEKGIQVFSPAIIDGSIGDMIYFNQNATRELVIDTVEDLCDLNSIPIRAQKTGVIILGAGLIKHHVMNANLMRNGSDFCVIINSAIESDGSDAGASEFEAISWGKISIEAEKVKVFSEVSLVFPMVVASTFKKMEKEFDELYSN